MATFGPCLSAGRCMSVVSALVLCLVSGKSVAELRPGQGSTSTLPGHSPLSADPVVEAHVGKGYEDMKDFLYREAAKEFRAALDLNPGLIRARYQLAICYFALGQNPEAREEFERLRRATGGASGVLYYLGRLDLLDGNLDSAIARLESLAGNPPYPDTAYFLGTAYLKKGNLQSAEKWLLKAAKLDPRDFRVHDHLARLYQRAGHPEKAEQEYARSTALHDYYNEATRRAVDCSFELETSSVEGARPACDKLFEPQDTALLITLGMLYGQHGLYLQALPPIEQAVRLDPDSYEAQHNLGLTYFRLQRYGAARKPLAQAVALRPDFFGSNALLGATLYALREDEAAYTVLSHAHELNPQDADTLKLLVTVTTLLGEETCAKKQYVPCLGYWKKATALEPTDAGLHRHLAELYTLLGQPAQAQLESREAERLSHP
jgi:tetratricopeptide (TPR) repeat protein